MLPEIVHDFFTSQIRTAVPTAAGAGLVWLGATTGVVIPDDLSKAATYGVTALVIILYYTLARLVEIRFPGIGRFLLSLGLAKGAPSYPGSAASSPSRSLGR